MELIVKHFKELTTEELWEIYRVRQAVFVVEQKCIYQDADDYDKQSYHLWLKEGEKMVAYARVLPPQTRHSTASIGRVLSLQRRKGIGTRIVQEAIRIAKEKFQAERITIEAQVYARKLYKNLGFRKVSEEFLEDGIPHIKMEWTAI